MPRNMSFAITTDQFIDQSKTVTRRLGWNFIKPLDVIMGVEKGMGLQRGEKVKRLGLIQIVKVSKERLIDIDYEDCIKEGFPDMSPAEFVDMFCRHNKCDAEISVNRIEYKYLPVERA